MAQRRRGATLLATFTKASGQPSIYWVASRVSKVQLLRSFSQVVYAHVHPQSQVSPDFAYPTWEMARKHWRSKGHRLIVTLDEFSVAVTVESALPSVLQNVWDHSAK